MPAKRLNYETILAADISRQLWVVKWLPSRGATRLSPEPLRYLGLGYAAPALRQEYTRLKWITNRRGLFGSWRARICRM